MFTRLRQKVTEESSTISDSLSNISISSLGGATTTTTNTVKISVDPKRTFSNSRPIEDTVSLGGGDFRLTSASGRKSSANDNDSASINRVRRHSAKLTTVESAAATTTTDDQVSVNSIDEDGVVSSSLEQNNHESSMKLQLKKLNDSLLRQIDDLTFELSDKLSENESLRSQLNKLNIQIDENHRETQKLRLEIDDYKSMILNFEIEMKNLSKDKDELIIKNAELSEKYEMYKLVSSKQRTASVSEFSAPGPIKIEEESGYGSNITHVVEVVTNTAAAAPNDDLVKSLRDELGEKNKVIKNLQQRLNDMKKTLLKELKYQSLPNEQQQQTPKSPPLVVSTQSTSQTENQNSAAAAAKNGPRRSNNIASLTSHQQQSLPSSGSSPSYSSSSSSSYSSSGSAASSSDKSPSTGSLGLVRKIPTGVQQSNMIDDVNFKYLKHVVLKFLTSREYEAMHLVKALSVLLKFTSEEEKFLRDTLQYRMSWFGSVVGGSSSSGPGSPSASIAASPRQKTNHF